MRADEPAVAADFTIGQTVRVHGTYVPHWEWARFELPRWRRRLMPGLVRCKLEASEGIAASVWEAAGMELPDNTRRHRGPYFDVAATVTPIERGRFGHRGTLRWRLLVQQWITVTPLNVTGPQP